MTLELGYGTHTSAGRALPWLIRQEWSSWEETPLQSSTAKNGRDPSSHPSHTVPLIPQVRGLGPPKEKLKEPVTLSVIFPSEEPISGAVRLLPTPTQALLLLQDPLGNTRLLPTGLPVPPHPDTSPRHLQGQGASGTNSPAGAQCLAQGCPAESSPRRHRCPSATSREMGPHSESLRPALTRPLSRA